MKPNAIASLRAGFLILLAIAAIPAICFAQTFASCDERCLSTADQRQFLGAVQVLRAWSEDISKQDGPKRLVLRRWIASAGEVADAARGAGPNVSEPALRRFFSRLAIGFADVKEILVVGDALLAAQEDSTTRLAAGVVSALISNEAKQLAAPISSIAELELRLDTFRRTVDGKLRFIDSDLKEAMARLDRDLPCMRSCR